MRFALFLVALLSGWTPTHDVPVPDGGKTKPLKAPSQSIRALPLTQDQVEAALEAITQEHGVEIGWDESGEVGSVAWEKATLSQVEAFLPTLREALSNYPKAVFAKDRLALIVLASDLRRDGEHCNGIAVHDAAALFVNVGDVWTAETVRHSIHHEVFHLIDTIDDEKWSALSDPQFPYGTLSMHEWRETPPPGFVTAYSRTSPREDRAEVFSMLVASPSTITRLARSDESLRKKIALLKSALEQEGFDAGFWNAARLPGR